MCSEWDEYGYEWTKLNLHSVSTTHYQAIYLISECARFLFWQTGTKDQPMETGRRFCVHEFSAPCLAQTRLLSWPAPLCRGLPGDISELSWVTVLLKTQKTCPDSQEKAMALHSRTLAWKIPWTEEPGGLQSMGTLRVRHDWATPFSLFLSCIGEGSGNPLQCSCLENPRDGRAWWLPSMGSHRVGHDWSDLAAAAAQTHRRNQGT